MIAIDVYELRCVKTSRVTSVVDSTNSVPRSSVRVVSEERSSPA
jgi:hypothetical protein